MHWRRPGQFHFACMQRNVWQSTNWEERATSSAAHAHLCPSLLGRNGQLNVLASALNVHEECGQLAILENQSCTVKSGKYGRFEILEYTRARAHAHSPRPFFSSGKTGKCGKFKMSYADVWSSRMGERWAIWNNCRHRQTDRQTHTHIYITQLSKKTNCVSFLASLQFPCTHVFKACGENVGKVKFTHTHTRTHAHEERGDVGNSKCSNKNKHTPRLTYVQEDRKNVDSTNARVHIFWLLVDCWQCGDLLKTGSRSRTDVLYKFLEANFTE